MGCICSDEIVKKSDIKIDYPSDAPKETYDFKEAKIVEVYDGDTIKIVADHRGVINKFDLRLFGIDCPEMKQDKALEQKIRDKFPDNFDEKIKEYRMLAEKAKNYMEQYRGCVVRVAIMNNKSESEFDLKELEKYGRKPSRRVVREPHGRLLGMIYYKDICLNIKQIEMGNASYYEGIGDKFTDNFK